MAEVLKQPIHAVLATGGRVVKYKDTKFPHAAPIIVLYSPFGNNSGHYDCLVPSHISVTLISPVRIPQLQGKRRQGKKTPAELLTASPYNQQLLASQKKKKNPSKESSQPHSTPRGKKTKKSKNTTGTPASNRNPRWFCFLCGENVQEDLIKCAVCFQWVHESCSGTDGANPSKTYKCDLCRKH